MNKRTFLRTSGALAAGSVLSKLAACTPNKERLKNWAGNLQYSTANVHYEKLGEFKQLLLQYDPCGKFRNEFLDRNLFDR